MKQIETNKIQIFISLTDIPTTNTRIDLIKKFLKGKYRTYSNTDCTEIQCNDKKYRSVSELYYIVCTRFPKTSFKGFLKVLKSCILNDKNIILVYCTQINNITVKYVNNMESEYISNYGKTNYFTVKGKDGLSLKKLEDEFNKTT